MNSVAGSMQPHATTPSRLLVGLLACLPVLGMAAVPPADPPVNYDGNVTFSSLVKHNVGLNLDGGPGASAQIISGADLQGYLWASNDSVAHWHAGSIASYLQADGSASIHVYGFGLNLSLVEPWFGGTRYHLTGMLEDHSAIDIDAYTYSGGSYILHSIPEPQTYALMLVGLAGLSYAARRKRA